MTRRLIVNADDFGLTRGVSEGILGAHAHGIVTSTTILVTADLDREQLARARDSTLGLGLHVNLTLGRPLTRARSLVGADARFVRAEIEAQVERFESLVRRRPTHLDTHHHVGLHPPVREIVLDVAHRLGVPVRSPEAGARARARAAGLRTPDHFFGESGPDAYWSPARVLARLRELPPGVSEFMTHPGRFDDALAFSRYGRQRETELCGLGTAAARGAAQALGVVLCHFGHL